MFDVESSGRRKVFSWTKSIVSNVGTIVIVGVSLYSAYKILEANRMHRKLETERTKKLLDTLASQMQEQAQLLSSIDDKLQSMSNQVEQMEEKLRDIKQEHAEILAHPALKH